MLLAAAACCNLIIAAATQRPVHILLTGKQCYNLGLNSVGSDWLVGVSQSSDIIKYSFQLKLLQYEHVKSGFVVPLFIVFPCSLCFTCSTGPSQNFHPALHKTGNGLALKETTVQVMKIYTAISWNVCYSNYNFLCLHLGWYSFPVPVLDIS